MKKFALFAVLLSSLAFGQRAGIPSFTAADVHEFDTVNLVTLVPSLNIPLIKGLGFTSNQSCWIFQPPHNTGTDVYCGDPSGNHYLAQLYFIPHPFYDLSTNATSTVNGSCTTYTITKLVGLDNLSSYSIPSTTLNYPSTCGSTSATVTSNDSTGVTATLTANSSFVSVTAASNTSDVNGINPIKDAFGNTIVSVSSPPAPFTLTDALGASTTLTGSDIEPTAIGYTDTTGTARTISLVNGTQTTFQPFSTCGSLNAGTNVTPVTSISFPDGTSFGLTWDTNSGGIDGLIKTLTLRTGGTISFTYGTVTCAPWSYATLSRVTADGTTSYSTSYSSGIQTTTVLDPGKNKIVYTLFNANQGGVTFTKDITRYQNTGTVASPAYTEISYTKYCYNNASCSTAPTLPITQLDTYEYLGTGPTQMSHDVRLYDSTYGLLTSDANTDSINSQTITKTIAYGTWNGTSCVAITNTAVVDHPCTITTKNGTTQLGLETLTYNANGAVTADANWVSSTDTLTTNYTRNSTGTAATITLPNSQVITNTFGSCNSLMLTDSTTTVNSVAIDNKQSWNCDAGVVTDTTDPNSNEDDYAYDSMNRLSSYTDRLENVTSYAYGTPTLDHVKITDPLSVVTYIYNDGLGRPTNTQVCQTTGCSNLDTSSKSYAWNGTNFETKTYVPCVKTTLNSACTTVALTADSNPVFGPVKTTDANSGTLTWARNSKDFSLTAGPAPSQENTKVIQTEIDGFGRVTSGCALEASGGTMCGQTMGNSGILTSNVYSFDATTGAPKVVATRGSQSHTTIADALGRITSVQTPEGGTVTDTYDTVSALDSCYAANATSPGNLMHHTNADSSYNCLIYDGLQRLTDVKNSSDTTTNPCKRFRFDSTANKFVTAPTGYPASPYITGRLFEAETDDCAGTPTTITDEWFAYDKDGHMTDMWESTPNSSGYYHTTVAYNADGVVTSLSGIPSVSTLTIGVDGESRPFNAELGTTWVIGSSSTTGVSYDAASRPLTVPINAASGHSDVYTYDNVGNMTGYTFSGNSKSMAGTLTWNSIGSLNKLVITDSFNSGGAQTCTYGTSSPAVEGYDDVGRLLDANCGSLIQHDSWTYDQYDNATRTGNPGTSWNPGYSSTNNEQTGSTYDSSGNVKTDGVNTYTWDVYGKMASVRSGNNAASCGTSGVCTTYDAFGRGVEMNGSGTLWQILFSPVGRLATMSGQTTSNYYLPQPGGGHLFYNGTLYFSHPDWLGTVRLNTVLSTGAYNFDVAYTPNGESYDSFGTVAPHDFTGDVFDITDGLYDTPNRELFRNSGRWLSPDPAHAGWNAYSYPTDPNTQTDPSGLGDCSGDSCPPSGGSPDGGPTVAWCNNGGDPGWCADVTPMPGCDNPYGIGCAPSDYGTSPDVNLSSADPSISGNPSNLAGGDAAAGMIYNLFMGGVMHANDWATVGRRFIFNLKHGGCPTDGSLCEGAVSPVGGAGEWTTPTFTVERGFSPKLASITSEFADDNPHLIAAETGDCWPSCMALSHRLRAAGIGNEVKWLNQGVGYSGTKASMRLSYLNPQFEYTNGIAHTVVITDDGWVIDPSARQFDMSLPFPYIFKLLGVN